MAVNRAKVITITSVKGGVGKTTTVLNLASIYRDMGKKVLILDLDLYFGAVAITLKEDFTKSLYDISYDIKTNTYRNFKDYVVTHKEIDVLPSPKDPRLANKINAKKVEMIISRVSTQYDVILIDSNHLLNDVLLTALDNSDKIVYLMTNDLISIKNMRTILTVMKDMERTNFKVVLNMSVDKGHDYFSNNDIRTLLKGNFDYIIPDSFFVSNIDKYVVSGGILIDDKLIKKRHKKGIKVLKMLAESLIKED